MSPKIKAKAIRFKAVAWEEKTRIKKIAIEPREEPRNIGMTLFCFIKLAFTRPMVTRFAIVGENASKLSLAPFQKLTIKFFPSISETICLILCEPKL